MLFIQKTHFIVFFCVFLVNIFTSESSFQSCNRYASFGYGYKDFFEYKTENFSQNQVFYLEFYVKTESDAHIMLKSHISEEYGYEIVIGGGSNTFSQIRLVTGDEKKTIKERKTEKFLSGLDYKSFYIAIDQLGIISVGKKKDDDVFLNSRLENPVPIKYFSFGSWTNVKGDWRFGCHDEKSSDNEDIVSNLSPISMLKNDLFTFYDPNVVPTGKINILEVKVNFQVNKIHLDEKRGQLTLSGSADLKWTDGKIRWKPEDYNGTEQIYIPPFQIWTPNIRVLNALVTDKTPLFDMTTAGVSIKYDGSVFWRPTFKSDSSCVIDLKNWPYDIHNCSVYFGFWMEPTSLVLTLMEEYDTFSNNRTTTEWEILEILPFNSDSNAEENYGILYVELRRLYEPYTLLLTVPFVAAAVMSLSSFWVPLYSCGKLYLICGSVIILISSLFVIGLKVPVMTENTPRIINIYSLSSVIVSTQIIVFVLLKSIPRSIRISECMSKVLNHTVLDRIFCLPELPQNLTEYSDLCFEGNKLNKDRVSTIRLVTTIERIFLFFYLIILIVPLIVF